MTARDFPSSPPRRKFEETVAPRGEIWQKSPIVITGAAFASRREIQSTQQRRRIRPMARKPNAAFMKPVQPDDTLAAVVGSKAMPRTELTKKLWAYIRKNGLQDKKNKRNINADDALKAVFGGKKVVSMFEMTKLVSKHVK
ncbi:MAG: hypothetical protein HUU04_03650 [Verrucomicrobiae bacterium]|nr:hypothetical protein [Verrucomicrobiae bacterium]